MDSNSKNNYWDLKPSWCQPWSIIGFGTLLLIFSWILFENIIVTSGLAVIIIIWWILFLIIAPNSYHLISDKKQS